MRKEKVAVIGGGGRESVLVHKYLQSEHVGSIMAIPGNDMMKLRNEKPVGTFPSIKQTDVTNIIKVCQENGVTFVDVAQDNAVEVGLVNALQKEGIRTLGPTREAGRIEWDKEWARQVGHSQGLPQPTFRAFDSNTWGIEQAIAYTRSLTNQPLFVKAVYLCEGKGALPAETTAEAEQRIGEVVNFKNGAGKRFLIEDWLRNRDDGTNGEEFSSFALSGRSSYIILGHAQDHKRVGNFDIGKNTGGMGCSTPPLALASEEIRNQISDIFDKTFKELANQGYPYKGILYLGGIIIREEGKHKVYVVEFNARWGDPEAQVIVPGIKNDLLELGTAAIEDRMNSLNFATDGKARVVVAGVSKGYPDSYEAVKGKQIFGLDEAREVPGVEIFGAGVKVADGKYYANGGRLFYIVGKGDNVLQARQNAYSAMSLIFIEGHNLDGRFDIGWRDMNRLLRQQ